MGPVDEPKEHVIKSQIVAYLRFHRIFCWVQYNGAVWDAKRGSFRRMSNGQIRGVADILGVLPTGKFLAIEVKTKTGRVSPHQEEFIKSVIANGGIAFVARSVSDVAKALHGR